MSRLLFLICVLLSFITSAQNTLTLQETIELALENNYGIRIARSNQEIADNNYTLGNAGFLPIVSVSFNKSFGVQDFERTLASGTDQSETGAENERTSYAADLNWTIFDGFTMFASYDRLSALRAQSEEQFKAEVELLIFNITSNYYQAVLEKERLILFDSNVLLSNERLQVARDKYELGKSSKLDFLQAQVDLNTDKSQRLNQQQVLINTKLELSRLISKEMDEFTLVYNLSENETLILETLLDGVENQNPQLTALKKQELAFQYDERINRGGIFPQVNLFAGYVHARSETPAGFAVNNTSDDITYGLTASWTLFNGFNTTRQIQNAKIQKDVASYQYQDQLISIRTAIRQGFTTYNNSIQLMELEKENLNVARENNEISKERYNIGLATSLELREAQQNFLNAELRFQDAAFNSKIAALELKYLAGISIR